VNYENLLKEFFKKEANLEYCVPIIKKLLRQRERKGYYVVESLKVQEDELKNKISDVLKKLIDVSKKEGFDASVLPTMISIKQAPNFYIEKEIPSEKEFYKWIFLLISGIYKGDYVINLENTPPKLIEEFREGLLNEKKIILRREEKLKESEGIDFQVFSQKLKIKVHPGISEILLGFLFISYFTAWIKEKEGEKTFENLIESLGLPKVIEKVGITDGATLIIFALHRDKKRVYYIPRIKNFIEKWYKEFLEGKEDIPTIVKFLFSFYILDKDYREYSTKLLDKFLYYFMQGYVNGELLSRLIGLKINYEFKKGGRIYGIRSAKQFFSKL